MRLLHSGRRGGFPLVLGTILALSLAAPVAAANPTRPFLGRAEGAGTIGPPAAACPEGSMFYVEEHDTGLLTHLGRVDMTWHHCAAANMATGFGWTTADGSLTMIAANGDRLLLSYHGTFQMTMGPAPTAVAQLDWAVTGGTGRFADATGSGLVTMNVVYTPDLTAGAVSEVWSGTISY